MISQSAFAKQVGVTKQAVSKAVKAGRIPVYDASGARVAADFAGAKYVKPAEASSAFKLSRARIDDDVVSEIDRELFPEVLPDSEPEAPPGPSDAAPMDGTLVSAKKAKEDLQSEVLRLRIARERGELVSRQAQLEAFETAGRAVGRQFQTMPTWAEELNAVARSGGVPALTAWLRSKANELCSQLADMLTAAEDVSADDDSPHEAD
jgi:hypothetical protein